MHPSTPPRGFSLRNGSSDRPTQRYNKISCMQLLGSSTMASYQLASN
jgi:hypothetical protein